MYKIPVKKRMVYSNAYAVRQQCLKYNDMFVRLDASVADLSKLPIISIEEGGDGIYTFLFDEMGTLRTGKVQNMFELETKHLVLTFKYRPNEVIAAGELKKSGNTIVFNLLSGTYMKELFYTISNAEVSNYINEVTALFNKVGYNDVSYTQQVLLSNEAAPLTKEQLDEYANIGVIIKLYKSKIACMQEPKILLAEMRLYKERGMNDLVDKTLSRLESSQNYMLYGGSLLTLGGSLPTLGGSKKRKTTRRRKTRKVQKQKGTRGRTQSTF